ncbi:MAG: DNA-primase RepB domain-containing protein [Solirubrobacteraceae bacterium]
MGNGQTTPLEDAQLYLLTLTDAAPSHTLLDIRYRIRGHQLGRFFVGARAPGAASVIVRIGQRTDVYVGCAPRIRRRGRRQDIAPTALLWADCDTPAAVAALASFTPAPSMIVASGNGAHAYWALTHPLGLEELEDANRRITAALEADPKCTDGARLLRVPGCLNFKHDPPRRVKLIHYTTARQHPADLLRHLPAWPNPTSAHEPRRAPTQQRLGDPLLAIDPARYVRVLTGLQVAHDGKIPCPLHDDERPSFHVYPTPEQGWACYGCPTPDGRPLGGDIYTLASLVLGIPATGRDFLVLRNRLDELFTVNRDPASPF